ncbi:BnaC04g05840D [Brassica napus]|uniref:glucan endo-1,3-beta-D-glucosidase n=2 Tax=Brassica TaxID=3705 RepID=A0A078G1N1_BRANA|nr:unnamed protein product [Brassica napus]CDY20460.1 BnaC04g05840D [Brassica napus]
MDSNTQQTYNNMFDEVMDATYSAMNALGYGDVDIAVGETGWPSACDAAWCTPQNAANYNLNIIKLAQNIGTPLMPNRHIDIYLFALFKPVQPNNGKWCVAKQEATDAQLGANIDWVCSQGIDCKTISPSGTCFDNRLKTLASFIMNVYYQSNGGSEDACSFGGSGIVVTTDPSTSTCVEPN